MGFRFNSMNEIGELDRFLYEENGNIIPDQIPISFGRVKLGGKAANVSDGILNHVESAWNVLYNTVRTALPREPWTVLKRTNTGVLRDESVKTGAYVYLEARSS
jgi:hypothetical protein